MVAIFDAIKKKEQGRQKKEECGKHCISCSRGTVNESRTVVPYVLYVAYPVLYWYNYYLRSTPCTLPTSMLPITATTYTQHYLFIGPFHSILN